MYILLRMNYRGTIVEYKTHFLIVKIKTCICIHKFWHQKYIILIIENICSFL